MGRRVYNGGMRDFRQTNKIDVRVKIPDDVFEQLRERCGTRGTTGLTLREIAEEFGVSISYVSDIARGAATRAVSPQRSMEPHHAAERLLSYARDPKCYESRRQIVEDAEIVVKTLRGEI